MTHSADSPSRPRPDPGSSSDPESSEATGSDPDTSSIVASSTLLLAIQTGGQHVASWLRASWLYQWLTKEPEPEVIVIDLRDTWTVGPFIHLLDRFVEWVSPYWESSGLKHLGEELERVAGRLADTRTGRLLLKLLEPPTPPADTDHTQSELGAFQDTSDDE